MKTKKWLAYSALVSTTMVGTLWFSQGCSQKVPALATMAVRPSPTVCGYQPVYTFLNGPGCWQVDTGTNGATSSVGVLTLGVSSAVTDSYAQSLQVAVTNGGTTRDAEINVNFSPTVNFSGKEMIMTIYVGSSLAGMAVQPYDFGGNHFEGKYTSVTTGTWMPVSLEIGSGGGNPNQVSQLGLQFKNIPASAVGDVYVDSVSFISYITPTFTPVPPSPTPTTSPVPTATPSYYWYFSNSSDLSNWSDTGLNTYNGTPVTGVLGWVSGGYNGAAGSLSDAVTFTGSGETDSIQYTFGSPVNFSGMNLTTIQAEVWIDGSLDNGSPYNQVYVSSGAWGYSGYTTLTPNSWTLVTYQPQWSNTGENPANLLSFWFTIRPTSGDALGNGAIKLDDVILN
jgi:hypothetical protein